MAWFWVGLHSVFMEKEARNIRNMWQHTRTKGTTMKITYEINLDTDNNLTVFTYKNAEKMFNALRQIRQEILDWKKEFSGCTQRTPHEILGAFYAILRENNISSDMLE